MGVLLSSALFGGLPELVYIMEKEVMLHFFVPFTGSENWTFAIFFLQAKLRVLIHLVWNFAFFALYLGTKKYQVVVTTEAILNQISSAFVL